MRSTVFCKHYRAMAHHETCNKGVSYVDFVGLGFEQRPCFERDGVAPGGCPLAEFPTAEERAAEEKEDQECWERISKARRAIVEHLGGPWKRGAPPASGQIDCPNCGAVAALQFSRAGCNGHIHARCSTEGCAAWIE